METMKEIFVEINRRESMTNVFVDGQMCSLPL